MLHHDLFPDLAPNRWCRINFSEQFEKLATSPDLPNPALDPEWCGEQLGMLHAYHNVDHSFGGYLEDRSKLWSGHYHKPGEVIHLGIDYNVPVRSLVHLPADGQLVAAELDPDQNGGWGGRSIFKIGDAWVIFAHMYRLHGLVGQYWGKGEPIGLVAPAEKNGGWYPHLHVQVMTKYDRSADGYGPMYDGIEKDFPDPEEFFKKIGNNG
jgi:murein DD-endopeptidase MepM/ murein hydrolase activator NlpD